MSFNAEYDRPIESLFLFAEKIPTAIDQHFDDARPQQFWSDPDIRPDNFGTKVYPASFSNGVYSPESFPWFAPWCRTSNVGSSNRAVAPMPCRQLKPGETIVMRDSPFSNDPPCWVRDTTLMQQRSPHQSVRPASAATLESIQEAVNAIRAKLGA